MQHCNSLGKNIQSSNVHSVLTRCRIALKKEKMLSTSITNANTLSTTFIPFFSPLLLNIQAKKLQWRKKSVNWSLFVFLNLFQSTQFQPLPAPRVSIYRRSCVYVLPSHTAHIQDPEFLWTLLIGRLNISPQFMSINFEYGQGLYELLNTHASPTNPRGQTGKKTKQQHKENREGGKKIEVGNMTKFLLSPYGCSTSDVRGLFFFKCSKHCTCLKSSVQKHGSNALFDCLAVCLNYMHYASLLQNREETRDSAFFFCTEQRCKSHEKFQKNIKPGMSQNTRPTLPLPHTPSLSFPSFSLSRQCLLVSVCRIQGIIGRGRGRCVSQSVSA